MDLGPFSISLTVKDLAVSKAFYEKLGFVKISGEESQNWVILKNGEAVIGLFQGMFEKNTLTFTPGLGPEGPLSAFTDVRALQEALKDAGVPLISEVDPDSSGPAHITLEDPDGNPILIDQHV